MTKFKKNWHVPEKKYIFNRIQICGRNQDEKKFTAIIGFCSNDIASVGART
jgi:hypothetical protein